MYKNGKSWIRENKNIALIIKWLTQLGIDPLRYLYYPSLVKLRRKILL